MNLFHSELNSIKKLSSEYLQDFNSLINEEYLRKQTRISMNRFTDYIWGSNSNFVIRLFTVGIVLGLLHEIPSLIIPLAEVIFFRQI